jgi:proteasome accessory factor A
MADLLFGVETEYAITGMSSGGVVDRDEILQRVMGHARRSLIHLPDMYSARGIFLQNGSRFYVDCGSHPEICTPECANPWDAVRYIQAGHSILSDLASSVESAFPQGTEILCFRCNVDYSAGTTWGTHESYLHHMSQDELQPQVIPHLVSRLIYTGAGGFNPLSQGLEFTLSPRMAHIRRVVSGDSMGDRGIWHTRSEPLSSGFSRLHVLCGESLCSETATFLKIGVTALIVAMADAGLAPGSAVQLADPLEALRGIAEDVTCQRPLRMADGSCKTAIAIQRHYLGLAEDHVGDSFMPAWAPAVCRHWRAILDQLEDAPSSIEQTLDWGIKRALYANQARALGVCWEDLPFWNRVIGQLITAFGARKNQRKGISLEVAIAPNRRMPKEMRSLDPLLQSRNLHWEDLRVLLGCRQKFFEIDTRFGQLGSKGIFHTLDTSGVLNHRINGVDNIEHAVAEPPTGGRAKLRGRIIQRLAGAHKSRCDWQQIVNMEEGQMLDLSDPFSCVESWRPFRGTEVLNTRMSQRSAGFLNFDGDLDNADEENPYSRRQDAANRILSGDYSGAETLLRRLMQERFMMTSTCCHLARVLLMTDREAEAREQINQAWAIREEADTYVVPRILFFQLVFAMLERANTTTIIGQIRAALLAPDSHLDWTIRPMLDHLRSRLGAANHRFLKALGEALSSSEAMSRLNEFPRWRALATAASDYPAE